MSSAKNMELWFRRPSEWENDERMDALFCVFKQRDLNPLHYDAKMKFWIETILSYCEDHGLLQIDVPTMVSCFRRKGKTPKCLDRIFEELNRQKRFMSSADYSKSQQTSWMSWTLNKVASPLNWMSAKTPIDQDVFIIKELVDKKAQHVLETLQAQVSIPTFDCVISYNTFVDTCRQCSLQDETSNNLVVSSLIHDKKILIDFIDDAKTVKVVKFAAPGSSVVRPITEIENSVLLLRHSKERLEEQLKKSEEHIEALLNEIRRHLKNSNRSAAMKTLRKKKLLEKEHDKKESTIEHLNSVLSQIEQTDCSSLVINAYSSGVSAHKELLRKNGLSPDTVENMLDEVHDMLDTQAELDEAFNRPIIGDNVDMNDLESELEDLLNQPAPPTPIANSLVVKESEEKVIDEQKLPVTDNKEKILSNIDKSREQDNPFADLQLRLQKLELDDLSTNKQKNPIVLSSLQT